MRSTPVARQLVWLAAAAGITLDQTTKALAVATVENQPAAHVLGGVLAFSVIRNPGAAFSFAPGATVIFTVLAVGVAVVIARVATTLRSVGWALALGSILAGAVGNLSDRLFRAPGVGRGAVVDFVQLGHSGTFNLADMCVTFGAIGAMVLAVRGVPMADADAPRTRPAE
jgi:signal peptidase II